MTHGKKSDIEIMIDIIKANVKNLIDVNVSCKTNGNLKNPLSKATSKITGNIITLNDNQNVNFNFNIIVKSVGGGFKISAIILMNNNNCILNATELVSYYDLRYGLDALILKYVSKYISVINIMGLKLDGRGV